MLLVIVSHARISNMHLQHAVGFYHSKGWSSFPRASFMGMQSAQLHRTPCSEGPHAPGLAPGLWLCFHHLEMPSNFTFDFVSDMMCERSATLKLPSVPTRTCTECKKKATTKEFYHRLSFLCYFPVLANQLL